MGMTAANLGLAAAIVKQNLTGPAQWRFDWMGQRVVQQAVEELLAGACDKQELVDRLETMFRETMETIHREAEALAHWNQQTDAHDIVRAQGRAAALRDIIEIVQHAAL
jgi:hypothetical protein